MGSAAFDVLDAAVGLALQAEFRFEQRPEQRPRAGSVGDAMTCAPLRTCSA